MGTASSQSATQLLMEASAGIQDSLNALFPIVYAEMRRLAASYLRRERSHTLQSTALVHEAYLRLIDQRASWQNRAHFLGIAAQTMRRILLDHAKRRAAAKRGGGRPITLRVDELVVVGKDRDLNVIALDTALSELEKVDPLRSRIVEMRFFGGLSNEEAAEVLGVSPPTVQRQWAGARAWLFQSMKGGAPR
jgi:RNA polymerase sigma-70 factor, ECF subfamily